MAALKPRRTKKIRVMGQQWTVLWYNLGDDLPEDPENPDRVMRGACDDKRRIIHVYDGQRRTLRHEFFEMINERCGLEIPHSVLQTLECVYDGILADNGLDG